MDELRYSRQSRFAPLGAEGQRRLHQSRVVVMGCGALGSGIAHILCRAGVGRLRIVDRDILQLHNLPRKALYDEADVRDRLPKAVAAARRLKAINSETEIEPIITEVTAANILPLLDGADAVADGSDNMALRFLLNDACVKRGVPWVYGGAVASSGMTMTIRPGVGPCLRCVIEELPGPCAIQTCEQLGVLNTLTTIVSAIESNEIIKLLSGRGEPNPDLLRFDVWDLSFARSAVRRRPDCPACGLKRYDYLEGAKPSSALPVIPQLQ